MIRRSYPVFLLSVFLLLFAGHCFAACDWLAFSEAELTAAVPEGGEVLAGAAEAYRKAAGPLGGQQFDLSYVLRLLERDELDAKAFQVLNEAMRRERGLEAAWQAIRELSGAEGSPGATILRAAKSDYNFLRCRLRLMVGLARAGVARRMADTGTESYASQAMEAAIDALRDSAAFGDDSEGRSCSLGPANPQPERVRALRARLLEIWELSRKQADTSRIRDMNLPALAEAMLKVEGPKEAATCLTKTYVQESRFLCGGSG